MKNELREVVFTDSNYDDCAAHYAARLAIKCYDKLIEEISFFKVNKREEIKPYLLSPEVIAAAMQIAYKEVYKLEKDQSIIKKILTEEEYQNLDTEDYYLIK